MRNDIVIVLVAYFNFRFGCSCRHLRRFYCLFRFLFYFLACSKDYKPILCILYLFDKQKESSENKTYIVNTHLVFVIGPSPRTKQHRPLHLFFLLYEHSVIIAAFLNGQGRQKVNGKTERNKTKMNENCRY